MSLLLKVENLTKVYAKRAVVDHVNYYVNTGEIVGLLGPNGAGKTTTFRMTVGMVTPTGGTVVFRGEDITRLPMYKRARKGMGYLSQESSVFQKLTVEENILAVLEAMKLPRGERQRRAAEALDKLELTRLRRNKAYTLSGGERRRLEITRALVCTPSLLLLDEPFSGVDPIAVFDIQQIILSLKEDRIGILLTDHSVRETLSICDRSYIISEGKVLTSGTSEDLVNDSIARKIYLGETFRGDEFTRKREVIRAHAEATAATEASAASSRPKPDLITIVDGDNRRPAPSDREFDLDDKKANFNFEYRPQALELDEIEQELERRRREHEKRGG
jgi:lipopolysaccharide export system ATP-binding protein